MTAITAEVYGCIRDEDYAKAIDLLQDRLNEFPRSRSILSLTAYCVYHNGEYSRASELYETLIELCPEVEEYRLNHVQSLLKSGSFLDTSRAASSHAMTSSTRNSQRLRLLQAQAEINQGLLDASAMTLSRCSQDDHEVKIALATLAYREGKYSKALELFKTAIKDVGPQPMLSYDMALCHYQLSNFVASLELVGEIIDASKDGSESYLVEALNLKATILYETKHADSAKQTLAQFTENLDAVTIHNDSIINIGEDPSIVIQKLEFLLSSSNQQAFPPETLSNLLTLYTSHGQDHLAAEAFQNNMILAQELFPPNLYAYFDAVAASLSCPDDAIAMLEAQITQLASLVRAAQKGGVAETTASVGTRPSTAAKKSTGSTRRPSIATDRKENKAVVVAKDVDALLDQFMPMLCFQAKLYWNKRDYSRAEGLLQSYADCCGNHDAWLLNMGHILFAQDKFQECISVYETLMKRHEADLLKLPAVALANVCVAYVMTNQNETGEELIRAVETEEHQQASLENGGDRAHSCIVNLTLGVLYCQKHNYEFGLGRIIKSMEPFERNICPDTWFYVKRSFLGFAMLLANQSMCINDQFLQDILCFFAEAEAHGKNIQIISESTMAATVASEATQLRNMFSELCA
jgi:tetratricopeptide repeat protein 30